MENYVGYQVNLLHAGQSSITLYLFYNGLKLLFIDSHTLFSEEPRRGDDTSLFIEVVELQGMTAMDQLIVKELVYNSRFAIQMPNFLSLLRIIHVLCMLLGRLCAVLLVGTWYPICFAPSEGRRIPGR